MSDNLTSISNIDELEKRNNVLIDQIEKLKQNNR